MQQKKTWFAAVAASILLSACSPAPNGSAQACPIRMPTSPATSGQGVVVRLLDHASAMALLQQTEARVGAPIDRAYLNNRRAVVRTTPGQRATVLIPDDMTVAVGDRIAFQSGYRSPHLSCSYVPNLATRRL